MTLHWQSRLHLSRYRLCQWRKCHNYHWFSLLHLTRYRLLQWRKVSTLPLICLLHLTRYRHCQWRKIIAIDFVYCIFVDIDIFSEVIAINNYVYRDIVDCQWTLFWGTLQRFKQMSSCSTPNVEKRTKLRDVQNPQENTPGTIEKSIVEIKTITFTEIRKVLNIPHLEPIVEENPGQQ